MKFKLPTDTQRITVIGKTGSGKTQGGAWLLSQRALSEMPWIVFDYKRDTLLNSLPGSHHIKLGSKVPRVPGLHLVHPLPGDDEKVEELLWKIWTKGHTGVFFDETYMIDKNSKAFQAILTQGRSKHVPVIACTQRPVEVSRFLFSEADYLQLFKLTDTRDIKTVKQFMPLPIEKPLPPFHSYWYDNSRNYQAVLAPVPSADDIRGIFQRVIGPERRYY